MAELVLGSKPVDPFFGLACLSKEKTGQPLKQGEGYPSSGSAIRGRSRHVACTGRIALNCGATGAATDSTVSTETADHGSPESGLFRLTPGRAFTQS